MIRIFAFLLFVGTAVSFATGAHAQGNLLVTPRRIVFEGNKRMQELNLANTGRDTATYLVSLMEIRMKEDGSFEKIAEPDSGQLFASPFLRYFPRRVMLAPGEAQMVKVQLVKTDQLQPGEYRSHLYFRAVPSEAPLGQPEQKDTAGISVRLMPVFGLTIPLIVRVGEPDGRVNLTDLSVETADQAPKLHFAFRRDGNMSVYGDLKVEHISPQGRTTQVAAVKGIAVYTPNTLRWFRVDLNKDPRIDYHSGKLKVTYELEKNAQTETLSQTELVLR